MAVAALAPFPGSGSGSSGSSRCCSRLGRRFFFLRGLDGVCVRKLRGDDERGGARRFFFIIFTAAATAAAFGNSRGAHVPPRTHRGGGRRRPPPASRSRGLRRCRRRRCRRPCCGCGRRRRRHQERRQPLAPPFPHKRARPRGAARSAPARSHRKGYLRLRGRRGSPWRRRHVMITRRGEGNWTTAS